MYTHIIKVNDAQQQSPLHLAVIRAHKHKQSKEDVDICREILERVRAAAEVKVHMDAHASRYLHSDRPIERGERVKEGVGREKAQRFLLQKETELLC